MTELPIKPQQTTQTDFLSRPLLAVLNIDWEKALYILFILIAIITRFYNLGARVMSHDESLHTQFSYQYFIGDGYKHTALMHGPFLFHITVLSYWLFGASDMSARLPVAVFGVVLVILPYLLRHWIGRIGALFASFIFLISPYVTYYSRYIRHDVYVITWALIIFFAIWYYLRQPKEKYLWWFAAGTALMFSTKEVAFIYVAIFGSFLVLRLTSQVWDAGWFRKLLPDLRLPIMILIIGLLMIGGSLSIKLVQEREAETAATATATSEGFAADPTEDTTAVATDTTASEATLGWIVVSGIVVLSAGLFLAAHQMRPFIDDYPEFDLIILFTTLLLPLVSPLLTTLVGQNPRQYNVAPCVLENQDALSALQLFFARLSFAGCWENIFNTSVIYSISFLIFTILIAVLVGIWWHNRRWLIAAGIFHGIFAILYPSVFTNPEGWASGTVDSLAYWLEQQGVARGNQPTYYYFFVVTFYEFLPLAFTLLAIYYWSWKKRIHWLLNYWLVLIGGSVLLYSLVNWSYHASLLRVGQVEFGSEVTKTPGTLVGLLFLALGILYWFLYHNKRVLVKYGLSSFKGIISRDELFDFIPSVIWWFLLTWVAYTFAGEKMPWLSIHFVIPMAFLVGWYMNDKLTSVDWRALFSRQYVTLFGLTLLLMLTAVLALGPVFLGTIQLGNQSAGNLSGFGRFLGSALVVTAVLYLWLRQAQIQMTDRLLVLLAAILLFVSSFILSQGDTTFPTIVRWALRVMAIGGVIYYYRTGNDDQADQEPRQLRNRVALLSLFTLLSLLTIRFTYMANYRNADYTTEFMVYAHGAPATKDIVMTQLEELSMRMNGDKSIRVAYDNDVSWPFTWYLRDYPNRYYFGASPNNSITESPIVIVGRASWEKVEPFLANNYEVREYTFLWWPMEEYRNWSWNAFLGDPLAAEPRGLGNANVRQALWDIFFYRDYEKYGQVFGGNYTVGEWPVRHDLRLYIRKDVLANLWDYGVGAVTAVEALKDPYEENELTLEPVMTVGGGQGTADGQFSFPRNVAVGVDGTIYVLDSGNNRVQMFTPEGEFIRSWGESGTGSGQFNEPWGIVVDENFVYVADTWNHRIQKFSLAGEWVNAFGISGSPTDENRGLGLFFGPRSLTLLPDNRLLVTDTGNHRLQVLSRDGQFITEVGSQGPALGQVNEPVGLATGPDGSVYLADTWNGRVQQFSPELIALNDWRVEAWFGTNIVNKPYLAVDSQGRIYVSDPEGYRILVFNSDGDYLARFGSFGSEATNLGLPNGLAIDAQDNLYVADADNHRILKYAPLFGVPSTELEPLDSVDEEQIDEGETADEETESDSAAEEPTPAAEEPTPTAEE